MTEDGLLRCARKNQKAGPRPAALLKHLPHWVPGRSEAPPGLEGYFFFDFLAFFAFFAFFAFLAIASSFGLWMETRHEACSAEGQPRNILKRNPNRFAARCPALSRRRHPVIHSCYAFLRCFRRRDDL